MPISDNAYARLLDLMLADKLKETLETPEKPFLSKEAIQYFQ